MSAFLLGVSAAILGNFLIGAGQTLQKYALNRLAVVLDGDGGGTGRRSSKVFKSTISSSSSSSSTATGATTASTALKRSISTSALASPKSGGGSRFYDRRWLLGFLMCYSGEIGGNWIALSLVSAAVVTPIGILSVLINALLASIYLGETLNQRAKTGYALISFGVLILLFASPKSSANLGSTIPEVLETLSSPLFISSIFIILAGIGYFSFKLFVNREKLLFNFVICQSLFATLSVLFSKTLSFLLRVMASSPSSSSSSAMDKELDQPADAVVGPEISPELRRSSSSSYSSSSGAAPISLILFAVVTCLVGTEFFKQQALGRFPVSKVIPLAYAIFSLCAALSNVIVFREITEFSGFFFFIISFIPGMGIIFLGITMVQQDLHSGIEESSSSSSNSGSTPPIAFAKRS